MLQGSTGNFFFFFFTFLFFCVSFLKKECEHVSVCLQTVRHASCNWLQAQWAVVVCRYSAGEQAHILFSVGIKDARELSSLMQRLNDRNMPTQDLSSIEAAQVGVDPMVVLPSIMTLHSTHSGTLAVLCCRTCRSSCSLHTLNS